jgi:PAS domain S-box-containing protein
MFHRLVKRGPLGLLQFVLLMLLFLQLSVSVHAQAQPEGLRIPTPKRVLLLYTYGDGLPAYEKATPAFISVMIEGGINTNDLFFEYLDLQRNDNAEYRQRLADLLRYKYAKHQVGLIVTVHTGALDFLLNEGKGLFPDVPIFSYLIVRPELIEAKNTGRRILQRPQDLDMRGTLEIALKMFPDTQTIVFVTGTAEGRLEYEAKRAFEPWRDKLKFQYTSDRSVEEILQLVGSLPPRSIVIYCNVFSDKTGRTFIPREVGKMVAKAANAPVFCLWDTLIGGGVIGGSLLSFEAEGTYAANRVLDILNGKIVLARPVTTLTTSKTFMFDWQQLKRWGVNEGILPKGSVLVNRVPTFWEQYKGLVIGGIAVFMAQTFLVVGLLVQRRRKKVAEQSLRQKTEELDQFFNITLDPLCIANTDGYFLRLNPAIERILGHTREELMAKQFLDFIHPDDLDRTRKAVSTLASQQKVFSFENRYRCKDGTYRWLEWSSAPAGNLIYAAARDVTDRKKAAEELKKSEERFRMLIETMNEGLGVRNEKGVWTYVNDQLCWMLGHLPGDIIGHPVIEFLDEANQSALREEIQKQRNGDYSPYEIAWTSKDGRKVATIVSPKPIFNSEGQLEEVFAVITDITERKRSEEEIHKAAEEWQVTFDSVRDLVMILDGEFKVGRVNAATLSFLNLPVEKVMGNHCYTLMHGTNKPVETCPLAKVVKTKRHEETELFDDKMNAWFHVSVDPILDDKGEITRAVHTVRDITERKRAEQEALDARRELLRMDRLSRMGELSASLSHELNQPLTAILSNARAALRFLQVGKLDPGELEEILQDIVKDDKRAGDIIRGLRTLVTRDEGERETISINDVLHETVSLFRSEAIIRNIRIEMDLADRLPLVDVNKVQIQQVLINLMMNAAESMTRDESANRTIALQTSASHNGMVQVAVRDFGSGIEEQELHRIFEPFFTTKRSGLGMGLSLSRSIIESHGGHIWAENNPDKGITFYFDLPAIKNEERVSSVEGKKPSVE